MSLAVTLRTETVAIILNQDKAEHINQLGIRLAQASTAEPTTETGSNPLASGLAKQIEQASKDAMPQTLELTLRALPLSKWQQCVISNTNTSGPMRGTQDMLGTAKTALAQMIVSATLAGQPADDEDLTPDALGNLLDQLTDGQFTSLWQAINRLNGTAADPKAATDLASKVLHRNS